ncbi:MAG: histidine kinase, partial [Psychroflexus sp.]|nr:histidine kinase [Psychroflexus sp.]
MTLEFSLFFWQLMVSALSIFFVISLIIGFNSKEKSFLFYANYTFFLLLYFIITTPYDFTCIDQLQSSSFRSLRWYSQVIYNCSYFIFFLYFLDVKQHLYNFYKFIIKVIGSVFTIATLVFIYTIIVKDPNIFDFFYIYLFVPILFCFAIYTLIKSCQLPGRLKYFFITGGVIFISFAMIALFFPIMGWSFFNIDVFLLFYLGIFIEQFVFALGLAYKVKLINTALLEKSLENQHIKENQNQLLTAQLKEQEESILELTAKAEKERVTHLRSEFENQIHHLHLVSLQNQMNPHFIFNALNSIKVFLIENEKGKAVY